MIDDWKIIAQEEGRRRKFALVKSNYEKQMKAAQETIQQLEIQLQSVGYMPFIEGSYGQSAVSQQSQQQIDELAAQVNSLQLALYDTN